ncbi:MAG: hypothetical protein ACR2OH_09565 [Microthrixaceae bacterium]
MSNLPPPDPNAGGDWSPPSAQPLEQPPQQPGGQWTQAGVAGGQPHAAPYPPQVVANPFDSESTPILVTGILSLALCGPLGIYAWLSGNKLRDRAQAAGWPEPSNAKVGRILGIVGTIIFAVSIVLMILYFVVIFLLIGTAATTAT